MSEPNNEKSDTSNSFASRVLITLGIVIPIFLLLLLFDVAFKVLMLVMAAVLVTAFLQGFAGWISQQTSIPVGWSLFISVLGIIVFVNLGFAPQGSEQVQELSENLLQTIEKAREYLNQSSWGEQVLNEIPENPQFHLENHKGWFQQIFGIVSSTLCILADVYIILLIGMYFTAIQPCVERIFSIMPPYRRKRAEEVSIKIYTTLERWLMGILFMLAVAVLTVIGLWLLDVPLALEPGLIAVRHSFISSLCPIMALIPASLIVFFEGPTAALDVALLYAGVQAEDSNFISTFIKREIVFMSLAMIIVVQILFGYFSRGGGLDIDNAYTGCRRGIS